MLARDPDTLPFMVRATTTSSPPPAILTPYADNILFTLHEKTSTLTAQRIPPGPNGTTFPLLANVSVIPANPPSGSQFAAAEILISTPTDQFPDPLIYVSNRNIGTADPNGDTIAIFQFINGTTSTSSRQCGNANVNRRRMIKKTRKRLASRDGESLQLLAQIPTGLQQIRGMSLGRVNDSGDQFLIAGANTDGGVAVFRRVDGGKNIELVARNQDLGNRTSFAFV